MNTAGPALIGVSLVGRYPSRIVWVYLRNLFRARVVSPTSQPRGDIGVFTCAMLFPAHPFWVWYHSYPLSGRDSSQLCHKGAIAGLANAGSCLILQSHKPFPIIKTIYCAYCKWSKKSPEAYTLVPYAKALLTQSFRKAYRGKNNIEWRAVLICPIADHDEPT